MPGFQSANGGIITFESAEMPLRQDERFFLVFQGLDTFATIWLNGAELGKTAFICVQ